MLKGLIWVAAGWLIGLHAVHADDSALPLCPGSLKTSAADPLLERAVRAAYPKSREHKGSGRGGDSCIYPYQSILYDSAVVLLTLGQVPGEGCHGCGAKVTAVFLKKNGMLLTPVARHEDFAEVGTFAAPNTITPIHFGGDDGIAIEGGGTFQGFSSSSLDLYIFRNGRAVSLTPDSGIALSYSNCGATGEGEPCMEIGSQWRTDPGGRLLIAYSGKREDKSLVNATAVYERRGDALVVVSGVEIAAEMNGSRP